MAEDDDLPPRLRLCERTLAVIEAFDRITDRVESPESFLRACVDIVARDVGVDLCQIVLLDEEGSPEQRATHGTLGERDVAIARLVDEALAHREPVEGESAGASFVAKPLSVAGEVVGVLVVGRSRRLDADERRLLSAACSRVDSALRLLRTHHQLRCRQRELAVIDRIDAIIEREAEFDASLAEALDVISGAIGAERSFIALLDDDGALRPRAVSHEELRQGEALAAEILALARETLTQGTVLRRTNPSSQLGSFVGVPLVLDGRAIGVFGAASTPGSRSLGTDAAALLRAVAGQMDTAVFEDRRHRRLRETFARYVSPAVVDLMLRTPDRDYLKVRRDELTMLFSDMRGFTTISQQLSPELVGGMLDEHFAAMTEIVRAAGGTVDKFVGDEVVAFWGAPLAQEDHARLAVRTALEMQRRQAALAGSWRARGLPEIAIGIGIATGEVVVGNIGSPHMMNYTVIGAHVNLAARLCSAAAPGQILLAEATHTRVRDGVRARPVSPLSLRHIEGPVQPYEVLFD